MPTPLKVEVQVEVDQLAPAMDDLPIKAIVRFLRAISSLLFESPAGSARKRLGELLMEALVKADEELF